MTELTGWERLAASEPGAEDARLIGALPAAPVATGSRPPAPAKIDWHSVPQVEVFTAADLERVRRETEARRWVDALHTLRVIGYSIAVVALAVLGFELAQRLFNRLPSDARLAGAGAALGAQFLVTYSTEAHPLVFAQSEPQLRGEPGSARATYEFTITLRLREPLYAPADSNGAQAYLALQRSVADAHARFVAARLFGTFPALATPVELPLLLAVTHRAGERLTIAVPVAATRRLFGWKLEPDFAAARVLTPRFTGEGRAHFPAPNLVFNRADTRETLRQLQAEARAYVLAVQEVLAGRKTGAGGGA